MSFQQEIFNLISSFTGHNANYVMPKEYMRLLKDSNAALILTQLVYWTGKQADPDGWIYKSYKEWEDEIFLSKKSVMGAVKKLKKLDIVETQVRKVRLSNGMLGDTCVHYRVNQEKLVNLLLNQLESLGSAQRELLEVPKGNFPKCPKGTSLSINTKTTYKNYDNEPPAPPKPADPPPVSDPQSSSSSSLSDNQKHDLDNLMQSVPESKRSPQVEARLLKALMTGLYTLAYLIDCIAYTIDHNPKDFVAYLGNCIDKGWAPEGYHHQSAKKADREAQKIRDRQREQEKQKQQQKAVKQHHERINQLLDSVDTDALDAYIDGQALNQVERARFVKGKRAMLRRVWIERYLNHNI